MKFINRNNKGLRLEEWRGHGVEDQRAQPYFRHNATVLELIAQIVKNRLINDL